jgi:hypothetical protein
MAGIARSIALFNSAYKLAWEHVSQHVETMRPNAALTLSNSIRDQIKAGATNAAEAITNLPPK